MQPFWLHWVLHLVGTHTTDFSWVAELLIISRMILKISFFALRTTTFKPSSGIINCSIASEHMAVVMAKQTKLRPASLSFAQVLQSLYILQRPWWRWRQSLSKWVRGGPHSLGHFCTCSRLHMLGLRPIALEWVETVGKQVRGGQASPSLAQPPIWFLFPKWEFYFAVTTSCAHLSINGNKNSNLLIE